jgi:hypothetical protein
VDEGLLAHHEATIFPLLHRRASFAGAAGFRLYDVVGDDGTVNEDVFAYSNVGPAGERSLVIFHNRHAEARGRIRDSVGFSVQDADGERRLRHETLGEGLGLSGGADRFVRMRDAMTGLEHLRSSSEIARDGLPVELGAYRCHVFVDVVEIADGPRPIARLAAELGGRGVPSIDEALLAMELEPVHASIRARLGEAIRAAEHAPVAGPPASGSGSGFDREAGLVAAAASVLWGEPFDERRLWPVVRETLRGIGLDPSAAERDTGIVRGLVLTPRTLHALDDAAVAAWFGDAALRDALRVHESEGVTWFERDAFVLVVAAVAVFATAGTAGPTPPAGDRSVQLAALAAAAGYRVDTMLGALGRATAHRSRPAATRP